MYRQPSLNSWDGRVDSDTDYYAFRWHQWIKPLDLKNADRPVGVMNIGFIGYRSDLGISLNKGRPGAVNGPDMIRKQMSNLPCMFTEDVNLYDCGDIIQESDSLEEMQSQLSEAVKKIIDLGLFPIVLGGGHELAYGHYMGLKDRYDDIGIINLDAHLDIRPYNETSSSGTMFRQIADHCFTTRKKFKYLCLGVQKRGNTVSLFNTAKELGAMYLSARNIINDNLVDTFDTIGKFVRSTESIYLTLCTDVISSAFAPGVSAAQPLGIHPERALDLIKNIVRSQKLVAFDIAEISPRFDHDNATANLAATFIFALVNELTLINGYGIDI